ncbi:MAG TPA: DUF1048 domain-containing protein [Firmicutes bacterium]|nr:DUF1048 domain-containing protein [Bacillota bacterium]
MKNFFHDYLDLPRIFREKQAYRQQMSRVKELPEEYRYMFTKIQTYMWGLVVGSGMDMMHVQEELLAFFEECVQQGLPVREAVGEDVAAFADEWLRNTPTVLSARRAELNRAVKRKIP